MPKIRPSGHSQASRNGARFFPWGPGPIRSCRVHSAFQHSLHLTETCATRYALYRTTFPEASFFASFFALKTHLVPMILAPGGACLRVQVPAVCRPSSSSRMACSHSGQSGLRFASARFRGSSASEVPNPRSQPLRSDQFSRYAGKPVSTFKQPCTRREIG